MSRYVITINTEAYKPMKADMKCWERETINDFMEALNGYKVTETNLKAIIRRINLFAGHPYDETNWREVMDWMDDPRSKAKITFWDKLCCMERMEYAAPYGFKQGYFNIDDVINELKDKSIVKIPFSWTYDIRQYSKRYDGCYMQIKKI